jgi:hypothetical protein
MTRAAYTASRASDVALVARALAVPAVIDLAEARDGRPANRAKITLREQFTGARDVHFPARFAGAVQDGDIAPVENVKAYRALVIQRLGTGALDQRVDSLLCARG